MQFRKQSAVCLILATLCYVATAQQSTEKAVVPPGSDKEAHHHALFLHHKYAAEHARVLHHHAWFHHQRNTETHKAILKHHADEISHQLDMAKKQLRDLESSLTKAEKDEVHDQLTAIHHLHDEASKLEATLKSEAAKLKSDSAKTRKTQRSCK
ncbi:MAG: hypothetical protein R3C28_26195 [Pirellulaceae bacterium]